ncbi:MAG: HEAT repeat domain-containing protein [Deltaproteobacteria bacterium]|nr:HEAT repeat domain-containing protein [Deltaproteobacteria bacterium]
MHRRSVVSQIGRRAAGALLAFACLATTAERTSVAQDKELAESNDFRVRVQAALRLGRAGGRQSRLELERGLRDVHPAVRVACAVGLGNIGDKESVPALEQAVRTESFASAKQSMKEMIEKIKAGGRGGAPVDPVTGVERAKYVVQLGTMRNNTGQRSDIDAIMRETAKSKASTIKGAVVLDAADETVLRRAGERKIPVLVVDGNLTKLSQTQGRDGGVTVSAQVDFSIRTSKQQLKGMVSGNAVASDNSMRGITELQNRAVNGAVESAMASVSSEIVALAK